MTAWRARISELLRHWPLATPRIGADLTDLGDRALVWRIDTPAGPYVAKLTFDGPEHVEPGLRIAAFLDAAGIPSGAPLPTRDGCWCLSMDGDSGRVWTLAVLRYVPGTPLDLREPEASALAGDLLGRVHRTLMSPEAPMPAGSLLDFYADEAQRLPGSPLAEALPALLDALAEKPLPIGTLYGDPAPEILIISAGPDTHDVPALIDWGTPSRGPLLFDVVTWHLFVTSGCPPAVRDTAGERFLAAYRRRAPLADIDFALWPLVADLYYAIQATWRPAPPP
ncbi:Ser/Thr protein kinase RdoA (MazF antagonist) [Catenulispora sp. GAS73]|uniref:phosphotransferase enzyme family protein n=1 Tax=Catenulispora sp. GAS73 TaxID=3156269 RepID=UPI003512F068